MNISYYLSYATNVPMYVNDDVADRRIIKWKLFARILVCMCCILFLCQECVHVY